MQTNLAQNKCVLLVRLKNVEMADFSISEWGVNVILPALTAAHRSAPAMGERATGPALYPDAALLTATHRSAPAMGERAAG